MRLYLPEYDDYSLEYRNVACPKTIAPRHYEACGTSFMQVSRHCEARSNPESLTNITLNNLQIPSILINTHTHTHTII
ncbi:MAG: hypothetical protein LBR18_06525 [Tannerella sp.]|nr:hypothetical protein [Tannerella sp.]